MAPVSPPGRRGLRSGNLGKRQTVPLVGHPVNATLILPSFRGPSETDTGVGRANMETAMVYERLGPFVVACHGEHPPPFDVWESYLAEHLPGVLSGELQGFLIVSEGGGPNALQRRQLEMLMRSQGIDSLAPSAIVTDSWTARQLAVVVSWFNPSTRTFAKRDLDKALDFLAVPHDDRPTILASVVRLQQQLGVPPISLA